MVVDTANNVQGFKGSHLSKTGKRKNLQFCPECMKADIKIYGEPYWHRIHQVPGVLICPWHQVKLRNTCPVCSVPILPQGMQYACLDDRYVNRHNLSELEPCNLSKRTLKHLISYAHEAYKLLIAGCCYEPEVTYQRYIIKLRELGLAELKRNGIYSGILNTSFK